MLHIGLRHRRFGLAWYERYAVLFAPGYAVVLLLPAAVVSSIMGFWTPGGVPDYGRCVGTLCRAAWCAVVLLHVLCPSGSGRPQLRKRT